MAQAREAPREATICRIEVELAGGDRIPATVGGGREAAREELAAVHGRLDTQTFVLIGEDTIVRSADVRCIRLREEDESPGILGAVTSRLGGDRMSDYESQQRGGTTVRQQRDDGGFAEQWIGYRDRPWMETKPFFFTSEFLLTVVLIGAILIATAANDNLDAPRGWLLAAIVGAAYIVSRGLAKAGTGDPNPERWGPRRQ